MIRAFQSILFISLISLTATQVSAQDEKYFSKVYLGGELGYVDVGTEDGFVAGVFLGGRYQTDGNVVFGAELEVLGSPGDQNDLDLISIVGTVGLVTGDDKRNLFYVGGGFEGVFGLDDIDDSFFQDDNGFSIIGGYERALHKNIAVRLQAKYLSYGTNGTNTGAGVSSDGISVTAGISINF